MKLTENSQGVITIGATLIIGIIIVQILHTSNNIIGIIATITLLIVIIIEYRNKQTEKQICKKKQKKN